MSQEIDSCTRDLLLTNASELIGDMRIRDCLGYSDHAMVEFTLLSNMKQTKSKIRILNFRKAKFHFFRELVNKLPGKMSPRQGKGAELADL